PTSLKFSLLVSYRPRNARKLISDVLLLQTLLLFFVYIALPVDKAKSLWDVELAVFPVHKRLHQILAGELTPCLLHHRKDNHQLYDVCLKKRYENQLNHIETVVFLFPFSKSNYLTGLLTFLEIILIHSCLSFKYSIYNFDNCFFVFYIIFFYNISYIRN